MADGPHHWRVTATDTSGLAVRSAPRAFEVRYPIEGVIQLLRPAARAAVDSADLVFGWENDLGTRGVSIFVENLADKTYRDPGSGVDGVGRNFGLTASVRF